MSVSEYEERFRPPAPSLHQIFAATKGRRQRRRRRIWVAAAVVGVLTIACRVVSHHAVHGWARAHGHERTTLALEPRSTITLSDEFRIFL